MVEIPTEHSADPSQDEVGRARAASGWGRLALALALLGVVVLLGLLGYKLAATGGWFRGGTGLVSGAAPGIFTNGQLVQTAFRQAPDFTLQLFAGGSLGLADLRGRPVMVNFWASWCPPCRQEAPLLEQTWREYRGRGVTFIGVDIWDSEQDARKFLKDFDITYPTGPDPRGEISINYGLTGIPETYFIDARGQVLRKWIGPFTADSLRPFLEEIVAAEGG